MKTTIEQGASRTLAHTPPPLHWTQAAMEQQAEKEARYFEQADALALHRGEVKPLPESSGLESKDQHADTLPSWKNLLKPGEEIVIKGVRFTYTGHGKRCIHLRRIP